MSDDYLHKNKTNIYGTVKIKIIRYGKINDSKMGLYP